MSSKGLGFEPGTSDGAGGPKISSRIRGGHGPVGHTFPIPVRKFFSFVGVRRGEARFTRVPSPLVPVFR